MTFGPTSAAERCPICLRTRKEAVADHLRSGENCDCPDCPFRAVIEEALLEQQRKPRFRFGPDRKPAFTFTFTPHKEPVVKQVIRMIDRRLEQFKQGDAGTA